MNIRLAWASAIGVLALAAPAVAHTVDCTVDSDRLQEALSRLERGSTLTIKGNCVGNVTVATDGASLVAHPSGGTITGQVEVIARRVSITGINIMGPAPSDATIVRAGLLARDGASVSFANGTIANHAKVGVIAVRNASVTVTASTITGNGTANVFNSADGVQAADGGAVMLGTPDANNNPVPSAAVEVAHNQFRGVLATRTGSVRLLAANIHDNGAQALVAAFGGSSRISGGTLSAPIPASGTPADVVIASFGGSVDIENDSGNAISNTTISGGSGGVIALDSGAARLRGVSITTSGGSNLDPSVGAFRSASIRLQGANTIANVNTLGGGFAVEIGDSASLRVDDGSGSGFPSGSNVITGPWQVFDAGQARIADAGLGSSITGSIGVTINSLLTLQRGTLTGDILVASASTLFALGGPIKYTGTITCRGGGHIFINLPNPFNPPQGPVCSP
ncbi:MAG TPA: right-handed parallel beta-helix repeat-containing protein [Stellaceae bacterium]